MKKKPFRPDGAPPAPAHPEALRLLTRAMAPALIALTLGLAPAKAELLAAPDVPVFSDADRAAIARNESLKEALPEAPWLVFRILRALDHPQAESRGINVSPLREGGKRDGGFDPRRDPDAAAMQRAEPEAAHDLFVLIKKAGGGKAAGK